MRWRYLPPIGRRKSAIRDYGADPRKAIVVPFGANFILPPERDVVFRTIDMRSLEVCHLVTIGVDWIRKGVSRAIDLATALKARGVPTELTVVGCEPPEGYVVPDFVHVEGYIDKNTPFGERHLGTLIARAHFHVLLSNAECFGVVCAEANAWGVPNIVSDVGGLPSAVVEGCGGWRFDLLEPITAMVDHIERLFRNRTRYEAAARRARDEYERRLNWKVAGGAVKTRIKALIG